MSVYYHILLIQTITNPYVTFTQDGTHCSDLQGSIMAAVRYESISLDTQMRLLTVEAKQIDFFRIENKDLLKLNKLTMESLMRKQLFVLELGVND